MESRAAAQRICGVFGALILHMWPYGLVLPLQKWERARESGVRVGQQESVRENQVVSVLTDTHLGLLGGIRGKTCGLQNELPVFMNMYNGLLLETDSKSLRSVNGSRRNSGSSLVSSSSASSNLSHLEEDSWILWGRIVNEWEDVRKKKEKQLKELVRKGIPHHFRAIVWQLLCNAQNLPIKEQYSELLKMTSPCEKLIRRDIARTYPEHEFFKEKDSLGQEAYSLVDREVGYCQGSAFIVGLLLMQMPEEEAFCVFVKLMQEYRLRELFKPSMAELGLCMYQFECMIQEQLPELHVHFQAQSFHTSMYASSWFLTIFLTSFPLPVATRIFDIFMCEVSLQGLEIVFRVGMAILQMNQAELMQLDMEGMLQHFQKVIPHQLDSGPDKVIQAAYQVKYNAKKMKKLEKEYTTIKTKEMEEQVEIKRLRTENRLLKQRIDTLEKGQVTRAQEAEENYLVKRELATVKQHNEEVSALLEQAQNAIQQLQQQQPFAKANPRYTEEFILQLERELVQARLKEAESQCALKEMQDKILDMEKRNASLPDESNVVRLQEELIGVKLREAEALTGLKELRQQVRDLEEHWQRHLARTAGRWKDSPRKNAASELQDELMSNQIHSNQLRRAELEARNQQERLQALTSQNKMLHTELQETKRKQAEIECKNKEEVMAVRLREADNIAAMAELQQQISELEIQVETRTESTQHSTFRHSSVLSQPNSIKEEGKVQGQLNNTDSSQYIRDLKDQIADLKHEIRCLRGQQGLHGQPSFDGIHIVNHYGGDNESYQSSDEDGVKLSPQLTSHQVRGRITLHPNLEDSESEGDEEGDALRLSVPSNGSHKTTTV
ncbi:hypothetical protein H4Q32_012115 [Labeo rohita]|uniref:Rab-GAP TBC domain-containing protein n=1 Tax=Labeo rohita TaxID=84645 RepID=A0ABQ8MLU9_LABRO|nr:hypothetical protein H4Q32_012115 [Labeo rohita]